VLFSDGIAPLNGAQVDWAELGRQQRRAAWFVAWLLLPLAALMLLARDEMPQYRGLILVSMCVTAIALYLPFYLTRRLSSEKSRVLWFGPLVVVSGFVALAATYLGAIGAYVLFAMAAAVLLPKIFSNRGAATWHWWLLWLAATLYLAFEMGGNKYANFFADRLALFGRTDGDIFAQGAIVGSIRSYGWPSFAIDGLAPLKYHVGALWLAARLQAAGGGDYIAAVIAAKIFVLTPLLIFAALQAAILFHAILRPGRAVGIAGLIGALGLVIFVMPYAGLGFATFASETMSLGAALALLVFPALYLLGGDPDSGRGARHLAWAAAAIAFFLIGGAKISMAFVLALIFAWWLLRTEGLNSKAFWLWGAAGFVAFLIAYLMFNDSSSMGAQFFGKPYYVEYGFERGDWWIPITYQIETLAALAILVFAGAKTAARRLTIETLIVAAIGGNLPGLIMYIQSGNAAYFLVSQAWIAIPILAALLPGAFAALGAKLGRVHRFAPAAVTVLAVIAVGYASYGELRTRGSLFLAANALLRSGDLSYYADDKRRVWRDDARRAVKEFGLWHLLTAPAATPPGEPLAQGLTELRHVAGDKTALYVPAGNADYWNLVIDCDGKSLFPVAEAGLAMIQGYVPKQSDCPQEIALRGFGMPSDVRPEETEQSICTRARDKGFDKVAWLDTLSVKDARLLDCAAAQ
jgi:hypothetical protein